jgi:hypothetical protein
MCILPKDEFGFLFKCFFLIKRVPLCLSGNVMVKNSTPRNMTQMYKDHNIFLIVAKSNRNSFSKFDSWYIS